MNWLFCVTFFDSLNAGGIVSASIPFHFQAVHRHHGGGEIADLFIGLRGNHLQILPAVLQGLPSDGAPHALLQQIRASHEHADDDHHFGVEHIGNDGDALTQIIAGGFKNYSACLSPHGRTPLARG